MKPISILLAALLAGCAALHTNPAARFAFFEVIGTPYWYEIEYPSATRCRFAITPNTPSYKDLVATCSPERSPRPSPCSMSYMTPEDGRLVVRHSSTDFCAAMFNLYSARPEGATDITPCRE